MESMREGVAAVANHRADSVREPEGHEEEDLSRCRSCRKRINAGGEERLCAKCVRASFEFYVEMTE